MPKQKNKIALITGVSQKMGIGAAIARELATHNIRVGKPEDAARLIRFLASEDARWITGQIIHSRGGL